MSRTPIRRLKGRGRRDDYALDSKPLDDTGAQAQVYRARHKPTGQQVAMKRVRHARDRDAIARMKREIEISRRLADEPHVMPVLDADPAASWLVMPLADGNLAEFRSLARADLRPVVDAVLTGLDAAHTQGWVHRDVKPANILRLPTNARETTWVLADWGLVRRPRGSTTLPGRTQVGASFGTIGFAAPESSVDAHGVTAAADFYSLGQVIGWALTDRWPQANIPLLPDSGPWRAIVRRVTAHEAARRPQTVAEFRRVMAEQLDEPAPPPATKGEELVAAGKFAELFEFAALNPEDQELYIDVLPQLDASAVGEAADADPRVAAQVARGVRDTGSDWNYRPFRWADQVIRFALALARQGVRLDDAELLEAGAEALFAWDDTWDQWPPQREIRSWLSSLRGEQARIVAGVLRGYADSCQHFRELSDQRDVDGRLRAVLAAA